MRMGLLELAVILILVALFAGPKQLPKLTKAITESMHSMKSEIKKPEESEEDKKDE